MLFRDRFSTDQLLEEVDEKLESIRIEKYPRKSHSMGPPRQATGPPRSDAGVGVGMLRGAAAFSANFDFMVLDGYEIHIQALGDCFEPTLNNSRPSSSFVFFSKY